MFESWKRESPLIRIYSYCLGLVDCKRKLFASLAMADLPNSELSQHAPMSSTRLFLCLRKLMLEWQKQLAEVARERTDPLSERVRAIVGRLRSSRELQSREEELMGEAWSIKETWEGLQDPLLYYEAGEREQVRNKVSELLTASAEARDRNMQAGKPLYVRKSERELRQTLQAMCVQEQGYNGQQRERAQSGKKRLNQLVQRLFEAVGQMGRDSLVEEEKTQLLREFLDVFDERKKPTPKDIQAYRKRLRQAVRAMGDVFAQEQRSFAQLLSYLSGLEQIVKAVGRQISVTEDAIAKQVLGVPQQINAIVSFEDALEITSELKERLQLLQELAPLREQLSSRGASLSEAVAVAAAYVQRISERELSRQPAVEEFIQDKKFMESLVKRERTFEGGLVDAFISFLEHLYKRLNAPSAKHPAHEMGKSRLDRIFERIFEDYFSEATGKRHEASSVPDSSSHRRKELEVFLLGLQAKVGEEEGEGGENYQCSLGPRLLLHGRMKVHGSGIHFQSNFNKRNLFFGGTKLFVPRAQICEINRQSVLQIFPDVIELVTNRGALYFHALGKRQAMYHHLNQIYFPEVEDPVGAGGEAEAYHELQGSAEELEKRISPYMGDLDYEIEKGVVEGCSLRTYFTCYHGTREFTYQGKTHVDFKHFVVTLTEGTNIKGTDYTPSVPYYLLLASEKAKDVSQNPPESQRFFTYGKLIPNIPFVSKGGEGVCNERIIYRWGGPHCLVIDLYSGLSGFSMTEGMEVRCRQVFRERGKNLEYSASGEVTFASSSALNGLLRTPALSSLKQFMLRVYEVIRKLEKTRKRSIKHFSHGRKEEAIPDMADTAHFQSEIKQLRFKLRLAVSLCILLLLAVVLQWFFTR